MTGLETWLLALFGLSLLLNFQQFWINKDTSFEYGVMWHFWQDEMLLHDDTARLLGETEDALLSVNERLYAKLTLEEALGSAVLVISEIDLVDFASDPDGFDRMLLPADPEDEGFVPDEVPNA